MSFIKGSFQRLYGSANIQMFLYYKNFPRDQTFQKCAVSSVCVTHLKLRLDIWASRSLSFGTSPIASGPFVNTKSRMTLKGFGFVTYDIYNCRILALSDRFVWGLRCTHRVALVRLPLLTAFAGAYYYAFRSFSVSGYASSISYSSCLLRDISCSLQPAYVLTTRSLV